MYISTWNTLEEETLNRRFNNSETFFRLLLVEVEVEGPVGAEGLEIGGGEGGGEG